MVRIGVRNTKQREKQPDASVCAVVLLGIFDTKDRPSMHEYKAVNPRLKRTYTEYLNFSPQNPRKLAPQRDYTPVLC